MSVDFENLPASTALVKCCDCDCSCSLADGSLPGTWPRTVKRKLDESDDSSNNIFEIPGFVLPQTARVGMENECAALREMVTNQQQAIEDLIEELEEERNASSSAANEAMSMILRLQREKADIKMEFRQFKMFTEEKMAHDQQEMVAFEELLYKREQTIQSLTCEVQMYKHRMMSYGIAEIEAEGGGEKDRAQFNQNGISFYNVDEQYEIPVYDYPPLKCNRNETQVYSDFGNESSNIDKYAFGETPRSTDQLRDLEHRINQLERTPKSNQNAGDIFSSNVLEKIIVANSPKHLRMSSAESSPSLSAAGREMGPDISTDSPRYRSNIGKTVFAQSEEYSNLRKVDNKSEVEDDVTDRVYTIDSIQQGAGVPYNGFTEPNASGGIGDDYLTTPRETIYHMDVEDPEIRKLYVRLQALEADRESMRQTMMSMRADKAQLILLKEIAQQLCKDVSPPRRVRAQGSAGGFSVISVFQWIFAFVFWRKRERRCKYMFGLSTSNAGLRMILDKGPRIGQWRCLSSTQV